MAFRQVELEGEAGPPAGDQTDVNLLAGEMEVEVVLNRTGHPITASYRRLAGRSWPSPRARRLLR